MVQDVRSSTTGVVYDLVSETGILAALTAVRTSQLSPLEKRALRDLIFQYSSSGGDPLLRNTLETRLASLPTSTPAVPATVTADVPPATASTVPSSNDEPAKGHVVPAPEEAVTTDAVPSVSPVFQRAGFGSGRPTPQFASVTATSKSPAAVRPELSVSPGVTPPVVSSPVTTRPVAPATVATTPLAKVEETIAVARIPDPQPVPSVPKAVVDEKLVPLAPVPEPVVEYQPPYREDQALDVYRARIVAIKQAVNTKVGNPVNLVDLNNDIGRAYMTALLEAMKAVSGGGGDPVAAIEKLEAVFAQVEALLDASPATNMPTGAKDNATAVNAPIALEPIQSMETAMTTPAVTETQQAVPITDVNVVPITPMTIASSRFKNVLPVADQEPLKTPADLPTAAELKARSGITDPLLDPDVDLGLEQLLGEWSLFKKSGMFGTGPKGRQHPLFLKLAPLQMPLILSGRFEGATNEIRQSITDYMNGWRYEQGIIYEQDETFEHYLRRVIRHIIDSQTRRRGA